MLKSHGSGEFEIHDLRKVGDNVIIEPGVLIFHPSNIIIGSNVYIGHYSILKAYYKNEMVIGDGTWIGQQCFFHSAGGIEIGNNVGIGPGVKILTSQHDPQPNLPVLHSPIKFGKVVVEDDSDLGVGSIILPGVRIGRGAIIGAGAVVNRDVEDYSVVAGVPAKIIKFRK